MEYTEIICIEYADFGRKSAEWILEMKILY